MKDADELLQRYDDGERNFSGIVFPPFSNLSGKVSCALTCKPLSRFQTGLSIFVAWWIGPVTMLFIWARYLRRQADLREADLNWANLKQSFLFESNLQEANLQNANLEGADLSGAGLGKTNLAEAQLIGASLKNAKLAGANLRARI